MILDDNRLLNPEPPIHNSHRHDYQQLSKYTQYQPTCKLTKHPQTASFQPLRDSFSLSIDTKYNIPKNNDARASYFFFSFFVVIMFFIKE